MMRRVLFVASMFLALWAAPAYAEDTYDRGLGNDQGRGGAVDGGAGVGGAGANGGAGAGGENARASNLARTGSNNVTPLIQAAAVLMGGGTLLVLVARRRHVARRAVA